MMKINSLILGIGETGVRAVNRIKSDLPDFHTATLSDENSAKISLPGAFSHLPFIASFAP